MAEDEKEQKILFNFLKRYQLEQHFEKLIGERVTRVQHLKNTRSETLRNLGLSDAEVDRLKTKLAQNFGDGAIGKVKVRRDVVVVFVDYTVKLWCTTLESTRRRRSVPGPACLHT